MNSAENTEECLDLYDDILVEDLTCQQDSLHEIEKKYKEALRTIAVLKDIKSQNEASITTLQKKNAYLMNNISVLYKTACVELERKKVMIESLQNERNSGFDYNYNDKCQNQMQASPYGSNTYESQNHKPYENAIAPYNHLKWNAQYADPHPSNSSIYPNDSVAATHIDAPHGTHDYSSPYAFPNLAHKERSDKHVSHNSHSSWTVESTYAKSYTSPMRNTDSHPSDQDLSFCTSQQARYMDEHTPHTRYFDEHIPYKKQTDLTSHGKHSSRKQSGSSSSHSKHSSSKTSTSSHSDKRLSSSKSLQSDSRKHNTQSSSTHRSESSSSRSKHSESKNSGYLSKKSSKDTSISSSTSSSRSRHRKPHPDEIVEASNSRRSNSSDSKHKTEKYREQKAPVESHPTEDENLVNSKRKLPREFSKINKSDHKRKRKEESKLTKESASRSSGKEKSTKSHRKKQEDLRGGKTKYKKSSFAETDRSVSLEINENKISDSEILNSDANESPLPTGQDLETDHRVVLDVPFTDDKPVDNTLQEVTESRSLESVTREVDDAIVSASINLSSTSENNHHESDIEDKAADVEREPNKCKQLDIETNESCKFVLCTAKELSDSEENLVCREAETELEAEKLDSLSDTQLSCKKEEASGRSSDVSDAKSDSSDDPKNRSIIIKCFGDADDASHSPIIIPCYPSKKSKSKLSSSASDSDEEYVSRDHLMSTPSKRLIARSLFPVTQPSIKKFPDMIDDSVTLKSKQNVDGAFEGSTVSKTEEEQLEKVDSNQGSEKSCSSDVSAAKSTRTCKEVECDNLDIASSPILEKLSDDLMLTTEEYNTRHWLDKDIETASSTKEDLHSDTSLDDNGDENCYPQVNDAESVDKNNISDDELEEGEILTDDENELVTDTVTTTEQATTIRSLVRYHKSFSPLDRRKDHSKWNREACRRKPHRESMKPDSRNSRVLSLHTDHFSKQSYRRDNGRSWQKKLHSSRSRQLDSYHRRSDVHYKSRDRSSSANRTRRTR